MSIMDSSGEEGNISWSVEFTDELMFKISVLNTETKLCKFKDYKPIFRPIFVLDILDEQNINKILDELVLELKD